MFLMIDNLFRHMKIFLLGPKVFVNAFDANLTTQVTVDTEIDIENELRINVVKELPDTRNHCMDYMATFHLY